MAGGSLQAAAGKLSGDRSELCICYGRKAVILLDEYDTPMQEAWVGGSWDEAVRFFRSFFNATFKTNPHMHRSLITGITRISKKSIFLI